MKTNKRYDITLVLVLALVAIMAMTLGACGKENNNKDNQQLTSNTPAVEDFTEPTEEVKQPEVEDPVEPTEDVEEPTEETTLEEPKVEMVDFETWAKQADNDEVCMVVWNEKLDIQEIMPTVEETKKAYQTQDGDKFAIPYRESIAAIKIDDESQMWSNTEYFEVLVAKGERCTVTMAFENAEGELEAVNYMFK